MSASLGDLADTATVTVYRIASSVVASPDTMVLTELTQPGAVGGQFTAVMYDRNGFVITPGSGAWVAWESLDTMIAQVDMMTGNVTASANGTARIVAHSFTGTQDTVVVVVDAPPPDAPRLVVTDLSPSPTWTASYPSVHALHVRREARFD